MGGRGRRGQRGRFLPAAGERARHRPGHVSRRCVVIDWLLERIDAGGDRPALGTSSIVCTYFGLSAAIAARRAALTQAGIGPGTVVSLEGDYGPAAIAAFLALTATGAVIVPISSD